MENRVHQLEEALALIRTLTPIETDDNMGTLIFALNLIDSIANFALELGSEK